MLEKVKSNKGDLQDLESLVSETDDAVLKAHKRVQEVSDRGPAWPAKKVSAPNAVGERIADLGYLVKKFTENILIQKFYNKISGSKRDNWDPRTASKAIKKELDQLVGPDEDQISSDERDKVWNKIKGLFT